MEAEIKAGQPEKFAQPNGLVGNTGVKANRATGILPKATADVRASISDRQKK